MVIFFLRGDTTNFFRAHHFCRNLTKTGGNASKQTIYKWTVKQI